MVDKMSRQIEKFESDYDQIFAKDAWTKDDIETMKDLQKLMYYIEVRCAMKDGGEYPGSDYMNGRSYANRGQMRNTITGRYISDGRSGMYPMYYDSEGMSGRRYYDSEKENAVHELHRMMESKNDPEIRMAIQEAVRHLEMK